MYEKENDFGLPVLSVGNNNALVGYLPKGAGGECNFTNTNETLCMAQTKRSGFVKWLFLLLAILFFVMALLLLMVR